MAERFTVQVKLAVKEQERAQLANLEISPDLEEAYPRLSRSGVGARGAVEGERLILHPHEAEGTVLVLSGLAREALSALAGKRAFRLSIDSSGIGEVREGKGTLHIAPA